jgi:Fe-S-cluster containining protein
MLKITTVMKVIVRAIAIVAADQVILFVKKYEMREHFFFLLKITTRIYYRNCIFINKENINERIHGKREKNR